MPAPSRVTVIGALGQVGRQLCASLAGRYQVVAVDQAELERRAPGADDAAGVWPWRADATVLPDTETACAGSQVIVVAARTTEAPARLTQAALSDIDLLLADTVARAAQACGATRIICPAEASDAIRAQLGRGTVPVQVVPGGAPALAASLGVTPSVASRDGASSVSPRRSVISVQRYVKPRSWSAEKVAFTYAEWLGASVPLVSTRRIGDAFQIRAAGVDLFTLLKSVGHSHADSCWLSLAGGALVGRPTGRFEFRALLGSDEVIAVLDGYQPALPWPVYRATQAIAHSAVMKRFGRWLARQAG